MADIVEKVPGWVEKFLLPNLDTRIAVIVKDEIDRIVKIEEKAKRKAKSKNSTYNDN